MKKMNLLKPVSLVLPGLLSASAFGWWECLPYANGTSFTSHFWLNAPEHLDPTIQTQVMYSRTGYALSLHKTCYHTDNNGQGTYHFDNSYSWSSHDWVSDLTDYEIHHHVYSEIVNQNDTLETAQLLADWQPE